MSHSRTPNARASKNMPLGSRNNNEPVPANNRVSKEFPKGMFTNILNTNRNQPQPPPGLEIEVVDTGSSNRHRNSQRLLNTNRESKVFDTPVSSQRLSEDPLYTVQRELEDLKREVFSVIPSVIDKKVTEGNTKIIKEIKGVVNQFNENHHKTTREYSFLSQEHKQIKDQVKLLQNNFNKFSLENEEKLESIFVDISHMGTGGKRSKVQGEYGVDLKNSFQAQNSSFVGSP